MWIETGQELLTDEGKHVAAKAAKQGVKVVYEEYETMPHCFPMMLEHLPAARLFFGNWAKFITRVVDNPGSVVTEGKTIKPKTLEETVVEVRELSKYSDEEVLGRMRSRVGDMNGKVPDPMAKL